MLLCNSFHPIMRKNDQGKNKMRRLLLSPTNKQIYEAEKMKITNWKLQRKAHLKERPKRWLPPSKKD